MWVARDHCKKIGRPGHPVRWLSTNRSRANKDSRAEILYPVSTDNMERQERHSMNRGKYQFEGYPRGDGDLNKLGSEGDARCEQARRAVKALDYIKTHGSIRTDIHSWRGVLQPDGKGGTIRSSPERRNSYCRYRFLLKRSNVS